MKYYAGIGSRETPKDVLRLCTTLATELSLLGYVLRSGGAKGADTAFEKGSNAHEIFTANSTIPQWAFDTVDKYHPASNRLDSYSRKLHARNAMILLGEDGNTLVDFIVCWTANGKIVGGTGQALRMTKDYNIPVYNLYDYKHRTNIDIDTDVITLYIYTYVKQQKEICIMTLNQQIRERVERKLEKLSCKKDLINYIVKLERDLHFTRNQLANERIQSGKSLKQIVRTNNY